MTQDRPSDVLLGIAGGIKGKTRKEGVRNRDLW